MSDGDNSVLRIEVSGHKPPIIVSTRGTLVFKTIVRQPTSKAPDRATDIPIFRFVLGDSVYRWTGVSNIIIREKDGFDEFYRHDLLNDMTDLVKDRLKNPEEFPVVANQIADWLDSKGKD